MSKYITVETEAEIDLLDYIDEFMEIISEDKDLLNEIKKKINQNPSTSKNRDYFKSNEIFDVEIPNKTSSLESIEVILHTKFKDRSRFYLNLNCVLKDNEDLKGIVSTNGRCLLLTSFNNEVKDLYKNYNDLKQIHISSLISQEPSNFRCELFLNKGNLLNKIKANDYVLQTEILEDKSLAYPDVTNLFKIKSSKQKDLIIKDIKIEDDYLLIENKYINIKEISLDQIKSLFSDKINIINDESKEDSPLVLLDNRNILVLMPFRKY